jgi:hypothetical protein
MSAPFASPAVGDSDEPGKALWREDAWEHLEDIRRLAGIAQEFLVVADDKGANYAVARLTANLVHVAREMRAIERGRSK